MTQSGHRQWNLLAFSPIVFDRFVAEVPLRKCEAIRAQHAKGHCFHDCVEKLNATDERKHAMKRNIKAIFVLAVCTLAPVAWAAEPGNDEAITKSDVAKAFKPEFSP
jgi:hypothetical protein